MGVREIPAADWEAFLSDFGRSHRAWLTSVEQTRSGGAGQVEFRNQSLRTVRSERAGERLVGIAVEFQGEPQAGAMRIDAPVRVRVHETAEGQTKALEIEDARGGRTRLQFRAAPPLEALDGLAPGEI